MILIHYLSPPDNLKYRVGLGTECHHRPWLLFPFPIGLESKAHHVPNDKDYTFYIIGDNETQQQNEGWGVGGGGVIIGKGSTFHRTDFSKKVEQTIKCNLTIY